MGVRYHRARARQAEHRLSATLHAATTGGLDVHRMPVPHVYIYRELS